MRNRRWLLLIFVIILSAALVGCGGKEADDAEAGQADEPVTKAEKVETQKDEIEAVASDALKERAEEEGVSAKEMQAMIDELTSITAEKFGDTEDVYKKQLEAQGKTPFDEFALAADVMGISIKEYVDYEKENVANMSQEQKDTLTGMADALEEATSIDTDTLDEAASEALEAMSGMSGAGDREVTGNYRDIGHYEVKEIIEEDTTSEGTSGIYMVSYTSEADTVEIIEHFKTLLEGTPDYFIMVAPGNIGAQIMGTVNGEMVALAIDNEDGDKLTLVDYAYSGDFGMEVESSDNVVTHVAGEDEEQDEVAEEVTITGNDETSEAQEMEGRPFDLSSLNIFFDNPGLVAYVISDVQSSGDGMDMISTHYVTNSDWNVYVETISSVFDNRPLISIYNDEKETTVMFMKDAPDLKETYDGYYLMYDIYSLEYTVGGIGNYDSLTANKIYGESDSMIDLHFVREDYEATVHYDKVTNMVIQFKEVTVDSGVTYTTEWILETMDFDITVDESMFDI